MKQVERKTIDQLIEQSEQFETQWTSFATSDPSEQKRFIDELSAFVHDCAQHGIFVPPGSAERRALRSTLEHWSSRLRSTGAVDEAQIVLAGFDRNAGVVLEGKCPYPGLDAYGADQRQFFFGREVEVGSAVKHLESTGNRILLILGSSGSGKSSLVLAGILPHLYDSHHEAWLFAPRFTPGSQPVAALAKAAADAIGRPDRAEEIEAELRRAPDRAHAIMAPLCGGPGLMLFIDQFEELLTLCADADEQRRFAAALCSLSDPEQLTDAFECRILLTLRTDHLDRFERTDSLLPLHRRLVGEHNVDQLSTIGFAEIRLAVKEPADAVRLRFVPPDLIDRLASQTAGLTNGLPLLQFALQRLWDTRPSNADGKPLDLITDEMVDALPDVQGALGKVAGDLFESFTPAQRRACERLLLELVVLDENFEEPLRRRRNERELIDVMQRRGYAAPDIERVIGDFLKEHLLRRFGEGADSSLEVAHEALLRHWAHIHMILTGAEVKERLHLVKQIGREAAEWDDSGRNKDGLRLHGDRLRRAAAYANDGWLVDATATDYIAACDAREDEDRRRDQQLKDERERADAAEKARQDAELKAARLRGRFWMLAVGAVVVALSVVGLRWWSEYEEVFAQRLAMDAEDESAGDPQLGLLLALEGARHDQSRGGVLERGVERALHSAVRGNSVVASVTPIGDAHFTASALSPDASLLVTGDSYGGIILWNVATSEPREALFEHVDEIRVIAFSPDGRTMASGGDDGRVVVWDVAGDKKARIFGADLSGVNGLAFSRPDGRLLASATADGLVHIWNTETGDLQRTLSGHFGGVKALAFGRDEHQLVTAGDDGRVIMWDAGDGRVLDSRPVFEALDQTRPVRDLFDVDISADGARLAVAEGTNVTVWDTATHGRLFTVRGHTNSVFRARFSGDGRHIATTSYDGTVRVWRLPQSDATGPQEIRETERFFAKDSLGFESVALAQGADGEVLAATSFEGKSTTVWRLPGGGERLAVAAHEKPIEGVAFNPAGTAIATTGGRDGLRLWDLSGKRLKDFDPGFAGAVAYGPDGSLAVSNGNEVLVWPADNTSTPKRLDAKSIADLAFSPDGNSLAAASIDGSATVWKLSSSAQPLSLPGDRKLYAIAFSPDGSVIATGDEDGTIKLWAAGSGKPFERQLEPDGEHHHLLRIRSLAFGPDGKLVSAGMDKTLKIWNPADGKLIAALSTKGVINSLAIHDGRLATASDDEIRIWDLASLRALSTLTRPGDGALSVAFSPDGRYLAAGDENGVMRVYAMRGQDLVALANDRLHQAWSADLCDRYIRSTDQWLSQFIRACPKSAFSLLVEANEKLSDLEFDAGERLFRKAMEGRTNAVDIDADMKLRRAMGFVWGADATLESPDNMANLWKGLAESPEKAARLMLDRARQESSDVALDPEARMRDIAAYQSVKQARNDLVDKPVAAVAALGQARDDGWSLTEPLVATRETGLLRLVASAWSALKEGPFPMSADDAEKYAEPISQAAALVPNIGPAYEVLALLEISKPDNVAVDQHMRKAAELESSVEPLVSLAQLLDADNPKEAKTIAQKVVKLDPESDDGWLELARAAAGLALNENESEEAQKEWEEAASAFDHVSPAAESYAQALNYAASIHFDKLNDEMGAYDRLTRSLLAAPNDLSVVSDYAELALALGMLDRARLTATHAFDLPEVDKPENAEVRLALSFILLRAEAEGGDREHALNELERLQEEIKAAAAVNEKRSSWTYGGTRQALERMEKNEPTPLSKALIEVLDFVESKGTKGSLDDMRQLLASPNPG
jgi:WD40 repeat protein